MLTVNPQKPNPTPNPNPSPNPNPNPNPNADPNPDQVSTRTSRAARSTFRSSRGTGATTRLTITLAVNLYLTLTPTATLSLSLTLALTLARARTRCDEEADSVIYGDREAGTSDGVPPGISERNPVDFAGAAGLTSKHIYLAENPLKGLISNPAKDSRDPLKPTLHLRMARSGGEAEETIYGGHLAET